MAILIVIMYHLPYIMMHHLETGEGVQVDPPIAAEGDQEPLGLGLWTGDPKD